ncbi:MAG: DctP family TRAP transporter solute-binding subunit [Clostridiales bacterium]
MKKLVSTLLCLLLITGLLAGCGGSQGSSQPTQGSTEATQAPVKAIDLKMNVTTSDASVWMVGAKEFKRIIEEKTNGKYIVSIFPNEQLSGGDLQKGTEMLFTGITDLDMRSVINMTGFDPRLTVTSMPWLFTKGYDSVDEILFDGEGGKMLASMIEEKGVKVLGMGENGFRQLTNNARPIHAPADLARLKIRTPPIAMYVELYKLFGADPTAMNFGEVFTSLQQGTIDGQENPYDTIRSAKIQEVQKYMTIWNYSYDPFMIMSSGKLWNSLTDEEKEIFLEAGKAAGAAQVKASREKDAEIIEEFSKIMEINELTPEEVAAFQAAAAPIYEMYKDTIGEEIFAAFGYKF